MDPDVEDGHSEPEPAGAVGDAHAAGGPVLYAPGAAKKLQSAARKTEALRLLAEGVPQTVIAQRLGVSQPRISAILKAELARSAALRIEDVDAVREQESLKLDDLEALALETLAGARLGWERSLSARVQKTRARRKGGPAGGHSDVKIESEARSGNPAFLSVMTQALGQRLKVCERRARLHGLDKPQKVALTDPSGELAAAFSDIPPATLREILRSAGGDPPDASDGPEPPEPEADETDANEPAQRIDDPDELRATLYKQAVREVLNAKRAGDKEAALRWARVMRQSAPTKGESKP